MKVIAAVEVDFERGALGTRSRLRDELLGETVLRRTLRRVLAARSVTSVHVLAAKADESLAREAAEGLAVRVETHDAGDPPWRDYVASARKWAADAWRGGVGGMSVFDEGINPWVLEALARKEAAEAVVAVPPAAPLLDPALLDVIIAHYEKVRADMRIAFTQSAPGLSAAIYSPELLADLAHAVHPPGKVMAYLPTEPRRDMVMQPCFYSPEAVVVHATGRCIADTGEAVRRIERILREAGEGVPDAKTISLHLAKEKLAVTPLPGEVEIELTTDDPLPDSTLRPRAAAVGRRGPMDRSLFERLIAELVERDDVRVVLGGFGDPLQHPQWAEFVAVCRRAGVFGLAVRTPAVTLDEGAVDVLIENRVDVLNVLLDATTAATYSCVHRADHFERVMSNLDRMLSRRHEAKRAIPLLVCEMMKTRETMTEMESFYDNWIMRTGSAVLAGPSSYSGRWADLAVVRMTPPARFACGRVFGRTMVLADGRVVPCDQDFRGEHAVGSLMHHRMTELWTGPAMAAVRNRQLDGTFDSLPLCAACEEWHRP